MLSVLIVGKIDMNKQALLQEIYYSAFNDELEKISSATATKGKIGFDKKYVSKVSKINFLNNPYWIKYGVMGLSVVSTNPYKVLVRGLPKNTTGLQSVIGIATGKSFDKLTLNKEPLIKGSEAWDKLSCEDPTYSKGGFYYSGVERDKEGVKVNLCFSDLKGNKKLLARHDDKVSMIKEVETYKGGAFVEYVKNKSTIGVVKRAKLKPALKKTSWYKECASTGPIKNNVMYMNGLANGVWKVGRADIKNNKIIPGKPIIWPTSGKICFSSGLSGNKLFFHYNDKEIWVAYLI